MGFRELLAKIGLYKKPIQVSAEPVKQAYQLSAEEKDFLKRFKITFSELSKLLYKHSVINYDRWNIYREIDRSLYHPLMSSAIELYSEVACLTGDTKVPLLDGRVLTMEEIEKEFKAGKDLWVYSCDYKGRPTAGKVLSALKQPKQKEVLRIWLDNGKYVDASIDHRFVRRNGELCRADELKVGDSLMPFHRVVPKSGYEMVWDVDAKKWRPVYKMVVKEVKGIDVEKENKGKGSGAKDLLHIHHRDFNKRNNHPDNLEVLTFEQHRTLHKRSIELLLARPDFGKKSTEAQKKFYQTERGFSKRLVMSAFLLGRKVPKERIEKMRRALKGRKLSDEHRMKISLGLVLARVVYGRGKISEEGRRRISESKKAWWKRLSESEKRELFKKVHTLEAHKKTGEKSRGRSLSEEAREKISIKAKGRFKGKTYEEIYGEERAKLEREKRSHSKRKTGKPSWNRVPREVRVCACGCGQTFVCRVTSSKMFVHPHQNKINCLMNKMRVEGKTYEEIYGIEKAQEIKFRIKEELAKASNNHKVVKIEKLGMQWVYDLSVSGTQLFGLDCGIYVHNTTYSALHNSTVWITADSSKYENILNKFLSDIGIEEKIYDWAWTVSAYGDLFIEVEGIKGVGIVSIDDSQHPLNISRLDIKGRLVGFFETPLGGHSTGEKKKLMPPWKYVHCRILGARRKRPIYNDPLYTEFAATNIMMTPDKRRLSTKYGTSILINALPIYKRLRLAEDAVMLARLSKGILRYIYKLKVDNQNFESVAELIDSYKTLLKRARAVDISADTPYFDEKYDPMGLNEDVIVPVWGDVNDLQIEKVGGEADIRFIVDVEELRNQLACALRVPLQLLGGYAGELPQGLSRSALEKYDVRFARQARRIQRALIDAVKRLCQIHLAYMGMDPSADLFEVNMPETSSAEEEEMKDSLNTGVDIVQKMTDLITNTLGDEIDKTELLDYLNRKILKLDDLDLTKMKGSNLQEALTEVRKLREKYGKIKNTDFLAMTPFRDNKELWEQKYKKVYIVAKKAK